MGSMCDGLSIRGQFPRGDNMTARFGELVEQEWLTDRLGFSNIVVEKHHAPYPLQQFQQIPLLARIMIEAPRLRLVAALAVADRHG